MCKIIYKLVLQHLVSMHTCTSTSLVVTDPWLELKCESNIYIFVIVGYNLYCIICAFYWTTSRIYPALPGQYRLKSSSWPGSGSGRGCLSGGGHGGGCLVVVVGVWLWW